MPTPKPRKVGRPKLPKGQAKATPIQVRLNPDDRKAVERAAKAKRQTVSDWIRTAIVSGLEAI
jgi:uncharacterized protein (DUF1778 family)